MNEATRRATESLQSIPRNAEGAVFREPWEAQAFALALSLNERGVFSWKEWAAALGDEIKKAQAAGDPDTGETYYHHWLATLERMVAVKGLADPHALAPTRDAWQRACARTPHGMPIELGTGDFAFLMEHDLVGKPASTFSGSCSTAKSADGCRAAPMVSPSR